MIRQVNIIHAAESLDLLAVFVERLGHELHDINAVRRVHISRRQRVGRCRNFDERVEFRVAQLHFKGSTLDFRHRFPVQTDGIERNFTVVRVRFIPDENFRARFRQIYRPRVRNFPRRAIERAEFARAQSELVVFTIDFQLCRLVGIHFIYHLQNGKQRKHYGYG